MSDLNDNRGREGGLFSDDYEIPKRENPYKKKKKDPEDRAAAYVPAEDKPAEARQENPYMRKQKEIDSPAPSVTASSGAARRSGVYQRSLRDRWSDFMFAHVKLICFIGGVIVVLLFIAAPAIYYGIQDAREQAEIESKDPLTMNYVKGLADKTEPITWSDFSRFYYEEQIRSTGISWTIPVGEDGRYFIIVGGGSTQNLPETVFLYDFYRSGAKVDLTQGLMELERFLEGRE